MCCLVFALVKSSTGQSTLHLPALKKVLTKGSPCSLDWMDFPWGFNCPCHPQWNPISWLLFCQSNPDFSGRNQNLIKFIISEVSKIATCEIKITKSTSSMYFLANLYEKFLLISTQMFKCAILERLFCSKCVTTSMGKYLLVKRHFHTGDKTRVLF